MARAGAREAVRVAGQVRTQSANLDICDENKQIEREMHALTYSWRKNELLLALKTISTESFAPGTTN